MRRVLLAVICLFLLSSHAFSQSVYVTDQIKAMFRTGPGNDHKIIKTVTSGEVLTVIGTIEKWSKVQRVGGEEGWVLTQWLTEDEPKNLRLRTIEKEYEKVLKENSRFKADSLKFEEENKKLKSSLAIAKKKERDHKKAYEDLKNGSKSFLQIQGKYKTTKERLDKLTKEVTTMDDQLTQKNIFGFLAGAGVLFLGIILGFSARKQRRSSY